MYESEGKVGPHDKCKSIITKLEEYNNGTNLFLQDITLDYLSKTALCSPPRISQASHLYNKPSGKHHHLSLYDSLFLS